MTETQSPPVPEPGEDPAVTTTGEGKRPPLAEDLKEAIRGGVQVRAAEHSLNIIVTNSNKKLNPSADAFSPLNPNSPEFTLTAQSQHSPPFTKHSIPASTSSKLNPTSKEFVPLSGDLQNSLPVSDSDPILYGNGEMIEEELEGFFDVKDIMHGFERAAPTDTGDASSEPVLKAIAEMLLKVFYYPASFDEIGKRTKVTLSNWPPSENTLINVVEMLVYWVSS